MLIRLFFFLASLSPLLEEKLWKWWYQRLAKYPYKDWKFMNYGYIPPFDEIPPTLTKDDEVNRPFIQLYYHALLNIPVVGKNMLEVGSGRGGGADYIARNLYPAKLVGVDISKNAINLCNTFYQHPHLSFVEGNSEKLPFDDSTFDIVYNIESSHCYGNMKAFIDEVVRVLKPGGYFAWADLRTPQEMEKVADIFSNTHLNIITKEIITPQVLQALDLVTQEKEHAIKERVPWLFRHLFSEFAGVKDSKIYNAFKNGDIVYYCYRMQKP